MFSNISSWVVSITVIVCLSVLVELILPDGQMNRYIKGIFSFVIVFVIISPIPKLLNQEISLEIFNQDESFTLDEDYLFQVNLDKLNSLQSLVENECESKGYLHTKIYLNADIFDNDMRVKSATVDLSNLVISTSAEHNDISKIKKHINQIITSYIKIEEESIFYDG